MEIVKTFFDAVKIVKPARHQDDRGFFSETYSHRVFAAAGIDNEFVQDNHSLSRKKGVIRGLHFQIAPFAQAKLLRVTRGAIFDVAVDIRTGSPTYGQHMNVTLTGSDGLQIFVPKGFAHGFCTLEPDTEVLYKVDAYYSPQCDRGLLWNDPALGIRWPVEESDAELSPKDRLHPRLKDLGDVFAGMTN